MEYEIIDVFVLFYWTSFFIGFGVFSGLEIGSTVLRFIRRLIQKRKKP